LINLGLDFIRQTLVLHNRIFHQSNLRLDLGVEFLSINHINVMSSNRVIVVGGGLAGLSAAHTLLERGASVLLLDKQGSVSHFPCRSVGIAQLELLLSMTLLMCRYT
jgi:hypothetical protein